MDTMQTWLKDVFPTLIEGYKSSDIYNADETGCFISYYLTKPWLMQVMSVLVTKEVSNELH